MILRPDTRTRLLHLVVRAHPYGHTPIILLYVRVMISSQRAVSSSGKSGNKSPIPGKVSREIPIIGSDSQSLFESLGITGSLRMVAIAIFAVLATIESMFWASTLWNKYDRGQ